MGRAQVPRIQTPWPAGQSAKVPLLWAVSEKGSGFPAEFAFEWPCVKK